MLTRTLRHHRKPNTLPRFQSSHRLSHIRLRYVQQKYSRHTPDIARVSEPCRLSGIGEPVTSYNLPVWRLNHFVYLSVCLQQMLPDRILTTSKAIHPSSARTVSLLSTAATTAVFPSYFWISLPSLSSVAETTLTSSFLSANSRRLVEQTSSSIDRLEVSAAPVASSHTTISINQ